MLRFLSVDLGQPKEAKILLPVARAAVARAGGGTRLTTILAQRSGDLAYQNGDLQGAIEQYEQAIAIAEAQPIVDQRMVLGLKSNIAGLADDMGNYVEAIAAAEEVLDAALRYGVEDAEIEANTYFMVHTSYVRLRRYDEAQWALDAAESAFEERYGPGHDIDRALLDAQAQLDLERGDFPAALERAQEALNVGHMVHEPDHPDLAITWNTLGLIHDRLGDDATAAKAYRRALEIWRSRLGSKHPRTLVGLGNWAGSLFDAGDIDQAKAAWGEALQIAEEIDGPTAVSVAYPLIGLAKMDIDAGRTDAAVQRLERAITLARAAGRDATVADAEWALAVALVRGGSTGTRPRDLARSAERFFAANAKTHPAELDALRDFIAANGL
jgi:tetratricopeptide (TPR) repeat protein